ncbi:MAG: trimethylamine methyltransferase family protein [Rhodoferax sp.]|nr:trimethylamine methyltransferase family protein [Rhodoferax sp.]
MNTSTSHSSKAGRRRGRSESQIPPIRQTSYRSLTNPFVPQTVFSDDQVQAIHATALRILQELGIKVLLPQALAVYKAAGAIVDPDTQMVRIGAELVTAALATAPRAIPCMAGDRSRDVRFELGRLNFLAGCGSPNVSDLDQGRRAGTLADFENAIRIIQGFDVLHLQGPYIEPQDIDPRFRHYAMTRAQLTLSDKLPNVYARGTQQVEDSFEMIRLARGLSESEFLATPCCWGVINTNSPRQLDIPMAQGIIDFARHGQPTVITPFCLAGAMAPVTVAGALALQHAEALAGITLAQLTRQGAPVLYGSFASNVDLRSGSPTFGTPEHIKATLGSGQLARLIGLPWRSGAGCAAASPDVQAAHETQFGLWASVLAGSSLCIHAAGWVEGGLTFSFEKLITDLEALQTLAELCQTSPGDTDAIGYDAIADVAPGGHFFSTQHTMERYRTAFYEPLVADLSNFGNWTESGALRTIDRARSVWKRRLDEFTAPESARAQAESLDAFIARRTAEGGAAPVS